MARPGGTLSSWHAGLIRPRARRIGLVIETRRRGIETAELERRILVREAVTN